MTTKSYLFPTPPRRDDLPLLPRTYHLPGQVNGLKRDRRQAVMILKMATAAKTDREALDLLDKHPDLSLAEIVAEHRRFKQHTPWRSAWRRLWRTLTEPRL